MRIDVALVPAEARRWSDTVCIVLDELRASSTIVRLLERGATAVIPAASLAEARRIAAAPGGAERSPSVRGRSRRGGCRGAR